MSLVELMVALLILGIVLTGLVAVTSTTLRITLINDQRTVASNLAQAEIERVRALSFEQLQSELGAADASVVVTEDGDYEVVRFSEWAAIDADTDPCAEPDGSTETAVIRVDVTVRSLTQPEHAVQSTTTVARPPATPASGVGSIAVRVFDHQQPAHGVPAVTVQAIGPEPSGAVRLETTPDAGCVLMTNLPTGNYEVRIARLGFVGDRPGPEVTSPSQAIGVASGERALVEFAYAPAGLLVVTGDDTPLGANPIALPDPLPVTIALNDRTRTFPAGVDVGDVFPGTWDAWAGDCRYADPRALDDDPEEPEPVWPGQDRQDPIVVAPGPTTSTGVVRLSRIRLNANAPGLGNPGAVTMTVRATALSPCANGTPTLDFPGTYPLNGTIDLGLPYGQWRLDIAAAGRTGSVAVTSDPATPAPLGNTNVSLS